MSHPVLPERVPEQQTKHRELDYVGALAKDEIPGTQISFQAGLSGKKEDQSGPGDHCQPGQRPSPYGNIFHLLSIIHGG